MKSYFIDTNILIYAQGAEHKYKEPCQIIMQLIADDKIYGVTNTEVLQEILYRYSSLDKKLMGIEMTKNALSIMHEILPIERINIMIAIDLLKKLPHLNVRDAIHASSAIRSGLKYILSVDRHFDNLPRLKRVDPFEI